LQMLYRCFISFGSLFILLPTVFWLSEGNRVQAREKITIGLVEDIILLPWGIKLPARIDTGAARSSLDARDLILKGKFVEFRLSKKYGGQQLRQRIVSWQTIRSAEGRERRPVVELELCVGPKRLRARINLNDRTGMDYPFLIGRDILRGNFLVDCMESNCAPPSCPEVPSK